MKLTEPIIFAAICFSAKVSGIILFPGSAVSWGKDRIDLFSIDPEGFSRQVFHKIYDGSKKIWKTEVLDIAVDSLGGYPVAITRGKDRLDVFTTAYGIYYQTWDGKNWLPPDNGEDDSPALLSQDGTGVPSVTSSDSDRVDVIVRTFEGNYARKYFNGTAWLPENQTLEDLGRDGFGEQIFGSDPASVSWEKNSLDVFGVLKNGTLLHKYWNGQTWKPSATGWQNWGDGFASEATPKVISRAEKTLEIFAWKLVRGFYYETWYAKWDSTKRLAFDNLGGSSIRSYSPGYVVNRPTITYSDDRIDLFDVYAYPGVSLGFTKWFASGKWYPANETEGEDTYAFWDEHNITTSVKSGLESVSWAKNNVNLFYYDEEYRLRWQHRDNGVWSPKDGDASLVRDTTRSSRRIEDPREQIKSYRKAVSAKAKTHLARPLVDQTRPEHVGL